MRALLSILLFTANVAAAAETTRLVASAASAVVLDGSSNVTTWRCRGTAIDAQMLVATTPDHLNAVIDRIEDGNIGVWMSNPAAARFAAPEFRLRIPVSTFRCGHRVMESDLREALKSERHPAVEFVFRELKGHVEHDIDGRRYLAGIAGDLSLAGATRRIDVRVSAQRLTPDTFRFRAEVPLRMTDFAVTPPTALFGAVRARNDLTVRFDLTLQIATVIARSQP